MLENEPKIEKPSLADQKTVKVSKGGVAKTATIKDLKPTDRKSDNQTYVGEALINPADVLAKCLCHACEEVIKEKLAKTTQDMLDEEATNLHRQNVSSATNNKGKEKLALDNSLDSENKPKKNIKDLTEDDYVRLIVAKLNNSKLTEIG